MTRARFATRKEVEAAPVVSPVQLCLDPTQTNERGKEAASTTLERLSKPQGLTFRRYSAVTAAAGKVVTNLPVYLILKAGRVR